MQKHAPIDDKRYLDTVEISAGNAAVSESGHSEQKTSSFPIESDVRHKPGNSGENSDSQRHSETQAQAVTITLSRGRAALIDAADEALVLAFGKWSVNWNGFDFYAVNKRAGVCTYLHRLILNAPKGVQVDHISGDTLDCRKSNLRTATASENSRNRSKRTGAASRHKGVDRHRGKWRARVKIDGKEKFIGCFDTEEAAALAYNFEAARLHGGFARLNQVVGSAELESATLCVSSIRSNQLSYEPENQSLSHSHLLEVQK